MPLCFMADVEIPSNWRRLANRAVRTVHPTYTSVFGREDALQAALLGMIEMLNREPEAVEAQLFVRMKGAILDAARGQYPGSRTGKSLKIKNYACESWVGLTEVLAQYRDKPIKEDEWEWMLFLFHKSCLTEEEKIVIVRVVLRGETLKQVAEDNERSSSWILHVKNRALRKMKRTLKRNDR